MRTEFSETSPSKDEQLLAATYPVGTLARTAHGNVFVVVELVDSDKTNSYSNLQKKWLFIHAPPEHLRKGPGGVLSFMGSTMTGMILPEGSTVKLIQD